MMNEAIVALRQEHSNQLEQMKAFYTEQISMIREEVVAAAASGHTRQATPATNARAITEEMVNLSQLTLSASD